jgi:hypothetical protein
MKKFCLVLLLLVGFLTFSLSAFASWNWNKDWPEDWRPGGAPSQYNLNLYDTLCASVLQLNTTLNDPKVFYLTMTTNNLDYKLSDPSDGEICDFPSQDPNEYIILRDYGRIWLDIYRENVKKSEWERELCNNKAETFINEFEQEKTKILTSGLSKGRIKNLIKALEQKKTNIIESNKEYWYNIKIEAVKDYEITLRKIAKKLKEQEQILKVKEKELK